MEISFEGKRALVTGAGQGIGREIAKKLQQCGAKVFALSRTEEHLKSLNNEVPDIVTVCVDLADWDKTKQIIHTLGPIHLLVNNAGVTCVQSFGDITSDAIDKLFSINVKAAINVSQEVVKGMKEHRLNGSIVNMSSQASMVALQDHTVYCATKAALDQVTRVMAMELGPHQIRVNSINPTVVLTDMAIAGGWGDPVKSAAMKAKIPLGKFCEVKNVVDAVIFLLSDQAAMITGITLPVDGGFTAC